MCVCGVWCVCVCVCVCVCMCENELKTSAHHSSVDFDPHESDRRHGNSINDGDESYHHEREDSTFELEGRGVEIINSDSLALPAEN